MTKQIFKISLGFIFSLIVLACVSQPLSKKNGNSPKIHFEKTTHTFTSVFEGEELSHTFTVFNRGTADLDIKKVAHS